MSAPVFFLFSLLLVAANLIVAANLRGSLTAVGPLLPDIRADLALSATAAGVLGSLPLLMFGVFAPMARLGARIGMGRLVMAGLVALLGGILLRSQGQAWALFAGTAILSAAIAMTNVLVPALVKQHYPMRVPVLTSAYATVMQVFASLASGIAVPLALWLPGGWRTSLACAAVPVVLAIVCWMPQWRQGGPAARAPVPESVAVATSPGLHGTPAAGSPPPPWRRTLAWQITLFMGLQSTLFYTAISWYPAYLGEYGFPATSAGTLMMVYQVAALLAGMAVPLLIPRFPDQRLLACGCAALGFTATAGLLLWPGAAGAWVVLLGIGAGPSLILALSFIGLRAGSVGTSAALSLMVQGVGYLIATFGPLAFGLLHDVSQGWTVPLLLQMTIAVLLALCGLGAGRRMQIP